MRCAGVSISSAFTRLPTRGFVLIEVKVQKVGDTSLESRKNFAKLLESIGSLPFCPRTAGRNRCDSGICRDAPSSFGGLRPSISWTGFFLRVHNDA